MVQQQTQNSADKTNFKVSYVETPKKEEVVAEPEVEEDKPLENLENSDSWELEEILWEILPLKLLYKINVHK